MKVFVYYNLHKKCWSVRDTKTRKVIGHTTSLILENCQFKVSEAGRQRVLREKRKNVHAGVEGYLTDARHQLGRLSKRVRYNPYEMATFQCEGAPILWADQCLLTSNKEVYI